MPRHICLFALLTLCLCTLAGAAPSEPAKVAAPAPPASATATPPAAVASPEAAPPAAEPIPAWLQPGENQSKLEPWGKAKDPNAPIQLSCSSQCWAIRQQCVADCAGDSSCIQGCADDYNCCIRGCSGYFCP
jgi:hypothetical protein